MSDHPPAILRHVLSAALPPDIRNAVLTDLDEEYRRFVRPDRGRWRGVLWYSSQVWRSLWPALVMRRRRASNSLMVVPSIVERGQFAAGGSACRAGLPMSRGRVWAQDIVQDLQHTARALRVRKGFAVATILVMALGIGATTTVFSMVDGILLRPLSFREPDRLIRIWSLNPRGIPRNSMSPPDFFDMRNGIAGVGRLAAFTEGETFALTGVGEPARIAGATVTSDFFSVLGVPAWLGRQLSAEDSAPERPVAVILSHRFWSRIRPDGGATAALDASPKLTLDGSPRTIVGVMPSGFGFPTSDIDVWVPLSDSYRVRSRSARSLQVLGRLEAGITIDRGREALQTVAQRLEQDHEVNRGWGVTVATLRESLVGSVWLRLVILLGASGCVLLIACANVASLLLTRGLGRGREMALRIALGATRARLMRQQLVESTTIALVGGLMGVALAAWCLDLLRTTVGFNLTRLESVTLDTRVLAVMFVVSILTGLGTGLWPAWRASRAAAQGSLRQASRTFTSAYRSRSVLVTAQIALTLALTIGAGLLTRTFLQVRKVDAGFRADSVLLAQTSLPTSRYPPDRWAPFFDNVLDSLRQLPSVETAGAGAPLPLSGQEGLMRFGVSIEGWTPQEGSADRVYLRWATPDYFPAMGIPVLSGRQFSPGDDVASTPVAIVDESFVRLYLPAQNPLGRKVRTSNDRTWREVVGVVGAIHQNTLETAPEPHLYVAARQMPSPTMTFVIRTSSDPRSLAGAVRDRVQRIDPSQPVFNVRTLEDVMNGAMAGRRFNALLVSLFAGLAGMLTLVGLYGMMSYWVSDSAREIGVRMALGATRSSIVWLLLGRAALPVGLGTIAGLFLSLFGARFLASLLYGVAPIDPITFFTSIAAIVAAALAGICLPARRALQVDPAASLRAE